MDSSKAPRIDHVVINVGQRLDEARDQFQRLGFQLTPRGHHSRGTSNHLAIFGDDYLELIGVEPARAGAAVDWGHPPGLVGLVFKTTDAKALAERLRASGVPLDAAGASDLSRPVELADGSVRDARFLTLRLAPDHVANGRIFFCDHKTPELVWQPAWQTHPNGVTGVAEYVHVSDDPRASAALVGQVFGADRIRAIDGGCQFDAGPSRVTWLTVDAVERRYGEAALAPLHALGTWATNAGVPHRPQRAIALELYCRSVDQAVEALKAGRIAHTLPGGDRCQVAPADAMDTTLVFRSR